MKLPILLFDGECAMCVRFKEALQRLDRDNILTYIDLNTDEVYTHFDFISKEECKKKLHLIDENKNVLKGGEVLEYLISHFPGVKHFAWLVESDSAKKALDFFYDKVHELRGKITPSCGTCDSDAKN